MTLIERQDPSGSELLRDHRHGQVRQAEIQVRIPTIQLERGFVITSIQSRGLDNAGLGGLSRKARRAGGPKR